MLANRVKETTATTGTGSFTTAGAVAGFTTFNTAFGTDRRFTYWAVNDTNNEWETGTAYLSASTTLVRETITGNSAGTLVAISFTTAPSLFCSANQSTSVNGIGVVPTNTLLSSEHITGNLSDLTLSTDVIYYMPFLYSLDKDFDSFTALCDTVGTATNMRVGLYENDKGRPGNLIVQTADMTPVAETAVEGSITQQAILPGWYFIALVTNGTMNSRKPAYYSTLTPLGVRTGSSFALHYSHCTESAASWTVLPSAAGTLTLQYTQGPKLLVRTV